MRLPDAPLVWVNDTFLQLSGYLREEVLGRNCRFLQGPGSDPRTLAEVADALTRSEEVRTQLVNYRRDGLPWWNELLLSPVRDADGALTHDIGVQTDITARHEAEQQVLHLAYHDGLTGLPNRARLTQALDDAVVRARRTGTAVGLLFVDLDEFKAVNDRYGHAAGDRLLQQVAGRLRSAVRGDDLLARHGGDEFLLLLTDLPPDHAPDIASRVAADVLAALEPPVEVAGRQLRVGASVGISVTTDAGGTELLRRADTAMYTAKRAGRGQAHVCPA